MLFSNATIGGIDVTCRIVRSATFEGMADANGRPTARLTDMYTTLADGGIGIIITGMIACSSMEPHQPCQIRLDHDDNIAALQEVTRAVHAKKGKIVAQLVVMGSAIMLPEGDNCRVISPSGIADGSNETSHELTIADIAQLYTDIAAAAKRAKTAGFDGIQFHGAHGYLASKFLSPYFNRRTDEYGSTLANRARFLLKAVETIQTATGPDFPVWVKLNCADFMKEGGLTFEESKQVMEWLADAGVKAIEISGGNTASLPRQGPIRAIRRTKEPMYFAHYAAEAAALVGTRTDIGVVGGFRSAAEMEQCLSTTAIAFISMCRPLLRQPDLPNQWRAGNSDPALCISCSRCFGTQNTDCIFNRETEG